MAHKPIPVIPVDRKWFKDAMTQVGLTQSEVASRIKMDKGTLSKILSGQRRLALADVHALASVLGVSDLEVYRHAGIPAPSRVVPSLLPEARQGGTLDPTTGIVTFDPAACEGADAVWLRAAGDGFVDHYRVMARLSDVSTPEAGAGFGLLRLADGRTVLGKYRPGFTAGRFDVGPALGLGQRVDDVEIIGVIPVPGVVPVLS